MGMTLQVLWLTVVVILGVGFIGNWLMDIRDEVIKIRKQGEKI